VDTFISRRVFFHQFIHDKQHFLFIFYLSRLTKNQDAPILYGKIFNIYSGIKLSMPANLKANFWIGLNILDLSPFKTTMKIYFFVDKNKIDRGNIVLAIFVACCQPSIDGLSSIFKHFSLNSHLTGMD
jgi:hypothetical protein